MKDIPLDELARLTRRRSSKVEPEPVDVSGLLGAVPVLAFRCSHLMSHRDERDCTSRCWLTRRRSSNVVPSVDVSGFVGFDSDPDISCYRGQKMQTDGSVRHHREYPCLGGAAHLPKIVE